MTTVEEWVDSNWNTSALGYHFTELRKKVRGEIIDLVSKVLESKTLDEKIDFRDIQTGDTVYFIDKSPDGNRVYISDYMEVFYTDEDTITSTHGARVQMRPHRVFYLVDRPDPIPDLPSETGTTIWDVALADGGFCTMLTRTITDDWLGLHSTGEPVMVDSDYITGFTLGKPDKYR